ncbi:twin-arginine translocase subunit TatC [bacterium]|nr:twin-arginine translocase subunit TatC [bacterium]MBU1073105.1 twin-arginine translocase subunit TatC [bacterium]MBU1674648.1 twin-arginine translocase subunit TatC [bacterium]
MADGLPRPDQRSSPAREPENGQGGQMTLLDHLEELRTALIQSLIAVGLAAIGCWFLSRPLLDLLVAPLTASGNLVYFNQPVEAFLTRMKLAVVCGIFVVLPFVLLRAYRFVLPGLYEKERKAVTPLLVASVGLFYAGVAFAYLVLIPKVMAFMLDYATTYMQPLIGIGPYFSFVARLCLAFGLVFELPLVILLLSSLGLVNPRALWRGWRYALVAIVVMSALLTPPDVFSQLVMAGPVMLLYLGSVGVAMAVDRRRRRGKLPGDSD